LTFVLSNYAGFSEVLKSFVFTLTATFHSGSILVPLNFAFLLPCFLYFRHCSVFKVQSAAAGG
jgi:hypothetical protein